MKAIILVGGFGKRLRTVLADVPKPMAPINDKPFLAYLLEYLKAQGIDSVIFSLHYMREKIENYFQYAYAGIAITYAFEDEPLDTGGAIVNALNFVKDNAPIFVLNGDTFLKLNYQAMYDQHSQQESNMTMALRAVSDCSRFGKVITDGHAVIAFNEKGEHGPGYINAGVYLLKPSLFNVFNLAKCFSIERDFLYPYLTAINPQAFITNDYFIDIGVPEDYARARTELPALIK